MGIGLGELAMIAFLLLVLFPSWILTLVHCHRHRPKEDRLLWTLILVVGGVLGVLAYWIVPPPRNPKSPAG